MDKVAEGCFDCRVASTRHPEGAQVQPGCQRCEHCGDVFCPAHWTDHDLNFCQLIEKSSLGSHGARALSRRTSPEQLGRALRSMDENR